MKKTIYNFIICLCIFMASTVSAHAQTGSLDSTFNADGIVTTDIGVVGDGGWSVAIQGDGKIVVVGISYNGSNNDFAVARYNTNGSLDSTFDADGMVTTDIGVSDDAGYSVGIQSDGKIVVAGYSANGANADFAIVRYNSDGSIDSTFDTDGMVTTDIGVSDDYGMSIAIQSDSRIVVAGVSSFGSNSDFALVRYNSDGSLDSTFDADGMVTTDIGVSDDFGRSVAIQSDGKIVVAGRSFNTYVNFALVRYNTNGSLDSTFDADGMVTTDIGVSDDAGYSVAIQSDGKIVVAGYCTNGTNADFAIVRYNSDGSLDSTFDADGMVTTDIGVGHDVGSSLVIQSGGKIVVAGQSYNGTSNDLALVRYNGDGSLDSTFDIDGVVTTDIGGSDDVGNSVAIQSDGKIVVAGSSSFALNADFAVVRYNGDNSVGIAEITSVKNTIKTYPNPFSMEILITGTKEKSEISIFNLMGIEMMRMQTFNKEIKINTENLLPGLYFLKYTHEGKNENIKLLKL